MADGQRPPYNERYAKPTTLQLGDLERLYFALAGADDYIGWLTQIRGMTLPGSFDHVTKQLREARTLANEFLCEGLNRANK